MSPAPPAPPRGGDKGGSKRPKARGAELERRLDAVEELVAKAWTQREIRNACAQLWQLSARQADEYVSKVYRRWEQEDHRDRAAARARQVRRIHRVIRRAEDQKEGPDYRTIISAEQLLARIEGTEYQPGTDDLEAAPPEIVIRRKRFVEEPEVAVDQGPQDPAPASKTPQGEPGSAS